VTLTVLEIVLGIDNIVFISIVSGRLPPEARAKARRIGLILALVMRIGLLSVLCWLMGLEATLFTAFEHEISGRDLILGLGGLFLLGKSTIEIHHAIEGAEARDADETPTPPSMAATLVQIALLDLVFSLDSVITAVGMADHLAVMAIAVIIAVVVMIVFVNAICDFVEAHPSFKMLALSFLLLIGVALIGESLELQIPKGYIYFAMGFSVLVEVLNTRLRKKSKPVRLRIPENLYKDAARRESDATLE
jgi:predicted tellurium resistance membrane protein TerC